MNSEEQTKNIILKHYCRYPRMQMQDMVKLIYQNEFAGGHFIENEQESLRRLQLEWDAVSLEKVKQHTELFEDIGNGFCRLHLRSAVQSGLDPVLVHRFFVHTANTVTGNLKSFRQKLHLFRQLCSGGKLPYPAEELDAYLQNLHQQGYPAISHSEQYRKAYSPAYRVIKSDHGKFVKAFIRIDSLLKSKQKVYVAIDGNSGAGKSTLAALIAGIYDCNLFHMDHFFLTPELRTRERLREIGGNVDYERFRREVAAGLQGAGPFEYRIYNCSKGVYDQTVKVTPKPLNIVEGCYSMHPSLIGLYDLKIFLRTDGEEQSLRILKRNGAVMHKRFIEEWIPLENQYFKELQISSRCDLVFEG